MEPSCTCLYDRLISDINTLQQEDDEDIKRLLLLHQPSSKDSETIVRAFIDMGADVEALDDEGERVFAQSSGVWSHEYHQAFA